VGQGLLDHGERFGPMAAAVQRDGQEGHAEQPDVHALAGTDAVRAAPDLRGGTLRIVTVGPGAAGVQPGQVAPVGARRGRVLTELHRVRLGDQAVLLRLVGLADAVQLQRPLQVHLGQVGLADRRHRTVRITDPAAQLVGRGEMRLRQLVQP